MFESKSSTAAVKNQPRSVMIELQQVEKVYRTKKR
jgi:hypothetical protein